MLHYQQQKQDADKKREEEAKNRKIRDAIETNFEKRAQGKQFQRLVEDKVRQKLDSYEAEVEKRRHKSVRVVDRQNGTTKQVYKGCRNCSARRNAGTTLRP